MSVYGHRYHGCSNGHDSGTSYQIEHYVTRTEITQPVYSTSVDQYKPVPLSPVKKTWYRPSTSPDYNRRPERVEEFTTNGQTEASRPHSPKHGPLATTIPEKTHGPSGGRHGIGHANGYHDNGHGGDYNYNNKKGSYQPNAYAPWNDSHGDKHRQNEKPTRSRWGSPSDSSLSSKPKNHVGSHFKPANHIGAPVDYYGDKDHKYDDDMEPSANSPGKQARPTRPTLGPTSDSSIRSKPTNHVGPQSKPTNHIGAPAEYYGDKHQQARPTRSTWGSPSDSSLASKPKNHVGSHSKPANNIGAPVDYYDNKGHQYDDDMEPSAISPGKHARPTRPTLGATSDSSIPSKPTKHVGPLSKPTNHTGAPAEYYGDKHSNKYDSSRQPSPINTGKQARPTHPPWDSSAPSKPKNTFGSLSKPTNETSAPEEYRRVYAKPTPTSPSSRPIVPASTWRRKPDTFSETIDSNEAARRYKYNNHDVRSLPPEDDTGSINSTEAAKRYGGVIFRG